MLARRAPHLAAASLLSSGQERTADELRGKRAELQAQLERSHRWRSRRHQELLEQLRIITEQLLAAEVDLERERRDRLLMRN